MACDLVIKFHSQAARKHFAEWLSEQGEQNYWAWMEYREQEEPGNITVSFDYYPVVRPDLPENNARRYGPFLRDGVINTTPKLRRVPE
jgi:hypothetical protein